MRILIIDGHPDPAPERYARALVAAYTDGAREGGHAVDTLSIAELGIAPLKSANEWEQSQARGPVLEAQEKIAAADHLVVVFPLWLGDMPARLKAFFEQVFRPGFAVDTGKRTLRPGLLRGKSARIIVTMGMPALFYRLVFRAHGLKSLKRNILRFAGLKPVRATVIGSIEAKSARRRRKWLDRVRKLGRKAV